MIKLRNNRSKQSRQKHRSFSFYKTSGNQPKSFHLNRFPNDKKSLYQHPAGFSQQYLDLARKHKITVLKKRNQSLDMSKLSRMTSKRIKTQVDQDHFVKPQSPLSFIPIERANIVFNYPKTFRNRKMFGKNSHIYSGISFESKKHTQQTKIGKPYNKNYSINQNFQQVQKLISHFQGLWDLKLQLNRQLTQKSLIKILKNYILQKKKGSVSNIHDLFLQENQKNNIKTFYCLERSLIIGMVDAIAHGRAKIIIDQSKNTLDSILGFYYHIFTQILESDIPLSISTSQLIKQINIKITKDFINKKTQIGTLNSFLLNRLTQLIRYNQSLLQNIKHLINGSKNISINKSFYDLLALYALYLNYNQQILKINYGLLNSFATAPSPYILKKPNKQYTLILDLDQTLVFCQDLTDIKFRPYSKQLIQNLSQHYQIIIFTCSMPTYADQIIKKFKNIDHILYRYHAIRGKNKYLKDISRVGRNLERIIIVDNISQNFQNHKENGIKVSSWYGDPKDMELLHLQQILKKLVLDNPTDIRKKIKQIILKN